MSLANCTTVQSLMWHAKKHISRLDICRASIWQNLPWTFQLYVLTIDIAPKCFSGSFKGLKKDDTNNKHFLGVIFLDEFECFKSN